MSSVIHNVSVSQYTSTSAGCKEATLDALCPSVVSLNKIIIRMEYFITVTEALDLPLRNVEASCHTFRRCFPPSTNSAAYQ